MAKTDGNDPMTHGWDSSGQAGEGQAERGRDERLEPGLETFFAAARAETAQPSDALMARILADAEAEIGLPRVGAPAAARPEAARAGFWATLGAAIGGWPALAGMATATVAGIWLGVAAPDRLATLSGGLIGTPSEGYELEDLLSGYTTYASIEEAAQ